MSRSTLIALVALGCGSGDPLGECARQQVSAIKLADESADTSVLPPRSVVVVQWEGPADGVVPVVCTATRIAPTTYVTARHCLPDSQGSWKLSVALPEASVASGACPAVATPSLRVVRSVAHETLDLALLLTAEPRSEPVMTVAPEAPKVDDTLQIAGFGLTEDDTLGRLRAIDARVLAVDESKITIQGTSGGACVGDSGGPLYATDGERHRLLGVLSAGSASCLGQDQYVNVASVESWIADVQESAQPELTPVPPRPQ